MSSLNDEIVDLQMKMSFQDNLLEELNQVIIDQQKQISRIELMLETMKLQMNTMQTGSQQESEPQYELPPHY
ncbi:MAG: SlyX family protein [Pseudomonadota bacterium]|nr:SlyX family protein [Pseudomonadota bacterium]MDO7667464.1 SlyX family protein [Pseudomonadota bacterium]MDO7711560.1 SlyX family protein [Pseudomonadota bacterium]